VLVSRPELAKVHIPPITGSTAVLVVYLVSGVRSVRRDFGSLVPKLRIWRGIGQLGSPSGCSIHRTYVTRIELGDKVAPVGVAVRVAWDLWVRICDSS